MKETLMTYPLPETDDQERVRTKARLPMKMFSFVVCDYGPAPVVKAESPRPKQFKRARNLNDLFN